MRLILVPLQVFHYTILILTVHRFWTTTIWLLADIIHRYFEEREMSHSIVLLGIAVGCWVMFYTFVRQLTSL